MKRAPMAADSNDTKTSIMGHVTSAMGTVSMPVKTAVTMVYYFTGGTIAFIYRIINKSYAGSR